MLMERGVGKAPKAVHSAEDAGQNQIALGFDNVGLARVNVESHCSSRRRDLAGVLGYSETDTNTPFGPLKVHLAARPRLQHSNSLTKCEVRGA